MNILYLILLFIPTNIDNGVGKEFVDLIELNHVYDLNAKHVHDQIIFYEWSEAYSEYHVREWAMSDIIEHDKRTPIKNHSNNIYYVIWRDTRYGIDRIIYSYGFKESWTQNDPERANKRKLEENLRSAFIRKIGKQ